MAPAVLHLQMSILDHLTHEERNNPDVAEINQGNSRSTKQYTIQLLTCPTSASPRRQGPLLLLPLVPAGTYDHRLLTKSGSEAVAEAFKPGRSRLRSGAWQGFEGKD